MGTVAATVACCWQSSIGVPNLRRRAHNGSCCAVWTHVLPPLPHAVAIAEQQLCILRCTAVSVEVLPVLQHDVCPWCSQHDAPGVIVVCCEVQFKLLQSMRTRGSQSCLCE